MTTEQRYKLVFNGQLLEGFEAHTVQADLAAALKLDDARLGKLFSGRLITVKRGLDLARAEKFRLVFERAGARALIHPDNDEPAGSASAAEPPAGVDEHGAPGPAEPAAAPPPSDVAAGVAVQAAAADSPPAATAAGAPPGNGDDLECPRCGHRQPVSQQCVHCHTDLRRHLKRLERRARLRERRRQASAG